MRVGDVARGRAIEWVVLDWLHYGKCGGDTDRRVVGVGDRRVRTRAV